MTDSLSLFLQGLDDKVIVFKYKRKKKYRRNIGHRQVITKRFIYYSNDFVQLSEIKAIIFCIVKWRPPSQTTLLLYIGLMRQLYLKISPSFFEIWTFGSSYLLEFGSFLMYFLKCIWNLLNLRLQSNYCTFLTLFFSYLIYVVGILLCNILQPNTRIRITGITGYEDSPVVTLDSLKKP